MSVTVERRLYSLHGIGLSVQSDTPGVLEAVEVRLRDFAVDSGGPEPELTLRIGRAEPLYSEASPPPGRCVYETPHGLLFYDPASDLLRGTLGGVNVRCDAAAGMAEITSDTLGDRYLYLATHPLLTVCLMELLERRGLFFIHAAALASALGEGVLLCGPSGAGKSTLALALALGGLDFLSDDIVWLTRDAEGARIRALSFADAVGVTRSTAGHFRALADRGGEPATGFPKRLERIEDLTGQRSRPSCAPRAIVLTEVSHDQPSRLVALAPESAFLRLVPDVLVTEPGATKSHLEIFAALLDQVDCYALQSGTDLDRAAEMVAGLI